MTDARLAAVWLVVAASASGASAQAPGTPDAVVVSESDDGSRIELPADRLLTVELRAQTSTGYSWSVRDVDAAVLALVGRDQRSATAPGGIDVEVLHFKGVAKGSTTLRLVYARPWELWNAAALTFTLEVDVAGAYTGAQLAPAPESRLAARAPVESAAAAALPVSLNLCDPGDGSFGRCTPIKDQGGCGSCWAFAAAGAFENLLRLADPGRVPDLSEQYLVSCDGGSCGGGDPVGALDYYIWNMRTPPETDAGAVYESDFPYYASDVACGTEPHPHHEKLSDHGYLAFGQVPVEALKEAMQRYGPIVAHVCADAAFADYRGGVFHGSCKWTNHAVVLVGWGEADGEGYWLLRNSWGTWWGEQGYMRIAFGANAVETNSVAAVYYANPPSDLPPFASAGPRVRACTEQRVWLSAAASHDPDGRIARYDWVQTDGPAVTIVSPPEVNTAEFVAPVLAAGAALAFRLTVADSAGQTASAVTLVDVLAPCPLLAVAGPPQTVRGGETVWLDAGASTTEPGSEIWGGYWTQTGGPPVALGWESPLRRSFWAPEVTTDTVFTFEVALEDSGGLRASDTTTVTVRANRPPSADAGRAQVVTEGATATLDGSASSDPEGSIASYRWRQIGGPAVELSGAETVRASFIAPPAAIGTVLGFELTVTDDRGAASTASTSVTVRRLNLPPVASAGPDQEVDEGVAVTLDGSGSADPDGVIASHAWTQTGGPAVTLTNAHAPKATFEAPPVAVETPLSFALTVTDADGASATATAVVTVRHLNRPPVADAGPRRTVKGGAEVVLDGGGSTDPEGALVSHRWAQSGGPPVELSGADTAQARFVSPVVSGDTSLTFRLSVADAEGATASADVEVLVQPRRRSGGCASVADGSGAWAALLATLGRLARRRARAA